MIQMEDGLSSPKVSSVRTKVNPCEWVKTQRRLPTPMTSDTNRVTSHNRLRSGIVKA
jgi:hypothetical protein